MEPLLTPTDYRAIAMLEEARVARSVGEVASVTMPFAGGIASRAEPGAWMNAAYGCGLSGAVDSADIVRLVDFYAGAGIEPRIELCPYAHESLVRGLADHGFVVRGFETIMYRALEEPAASVPEPASLCSARIETVDPKNERAVEEFIHVACSGFLPPGMKEWPAEYLASVRRVVHHPRTVCVVARLGGVCAGAGALEVLGEVSALFGLSVLPEFRRRGVQLALMAWRLRHAMAQGARYATIGARPGVATERNAQRLGFRIAYTRALMVRPGHGLAPVIE